MDRRDIVDAWFVATAFPLDTRRPGMPWEIYEMLCYHPERHEILDLAARNGWTADQVQQELAARFEARWMTKEAG